MKTFLLGMFLAFATVAPALAAYNFVTIAGVAPGDADGVGAGPRFNQPEGIAADTSGNLYVADTTNHTIRKISRAGVVTTIAGSPGASGSADGTGAAVRFNLPSGIAVDSAGNVYVADSYNHTIRKITPAGVVTTLAGTAGGNDYADGTGAAARFSEPKGVAVDSAGNVFVADTYNYSIRKITPAGVVTTFAGTAGAPGSADGTGSAARFNLPYGVAVDSANNVYVGDTSNHTIRKITSGGVVTTLAGLAGAPGGADGTGSVARFNNPGHILVDSSGNVYVADSYNHTIREVTAAGVVTTLAGSAGWVGSVDGTGSAARFTYPYGVALDASGNVLVADTDNFTIRKISPAGVVSTFAGTAGTPGIADGAANGNAPQARFYHPSSVAVDNAGNVIVAEPAVGAIRKITPDGLVSTLASSTAQVSFENPSGVAIDSSGTVYVSDDARIQKITSTGVVTLLAGMAYSTGSADGTGPDARFYLPSGMAVDAGGNVYVADTYNDTIRKITAAGVVTTLAGTAGVAGSTDGTGAAARFSLPSGLALDGAGNIYVADRGNNTIRKITAGGVVTTLAGSATGSGSTDGTGAAARFNAPRGVAVDTGGNVFVADTFSSTVRKVTPAGVVTTLAGTAASTGGTDGVGAAARFSSPYGLGVDASGNLYVADTFNDTIRKVTPTGLVTTVAGAVSSGSADGTVASARFSNPNGVTVDNSGNVLVADTDNHTIRKISPTGVVSTLAGTAGMSGTANGTGAAARFWSPAGIAVDGNGNAYVADTGNFAIRKVTPAGVVTTFAGLPGTFGNVDGTGTAARFWNPSGVAVDGTGNVYVADSTNQTIRKISPAGVVSTLAGTAGSSGSTDGTGAAARFYQPRGVAVDSTGQVFVADAYNCTIRKITPAGVVTTLAGSPGVSGHADGTGSAAWFYRPYGVAVNQAGNIFVADLNDSTIRKVTPAGVVTTVAGNMYVGGDVDGTGAAARFFSPAGIAINAAGFLYVAESTNNTIRKGSPVADVADFNGDGEADLLWQDTVTGERTIWFMNGATFLSGFSLGVIPTAWSIAGTGDFNGDGKTDILWQNTTTGERAIWLMNGGSFLSNISLGVISTNWSIAGTGDFNGDGQTDILWQNRVTGERIFWLMNGTAFASSVSLGVVPITWSIVGTGDFNGDGLIDIVWQNTTTGELILWLMDGTSFASGVSLGIAPAHMQVADTGDYNGDGKTDFLFTNVLTGERIVWLMNGTTVASAESIGTVALEWALIPPPAPAEISGDFNGDGDTDLIWQNSSTGELSIWLMNGTSFATNVSLGVAPAQWQVAGSGDFNGDGMPDIVWQNSSTGERLIWLMNGTAFSSSVSLGVVSTQWQIVGTGDFNGDGKIDVLWQNTSTGERCVWLMNGTQYVSGVSLGDVSTQWQIAGTGDFNGDGKPDILWENTSTGERYVWLMNGTTFSSSVFLATVATNWSMAGTGSLGGDGSCDIIWQNLSTGERVVWLMNGTTFISGVSLGVVPVQWSIRN